MWDRECIHGLLQSMSPVNDAFPRAALSQHRRHTRPGCTNPSPLQTRMRDFSLLITPFPCARLNCGSWRDAFQRKVWRAAEVPRICSTVPAGAASRSVPFSLPIKKTSRAARGTAESVSTRPRSDSKPCYGAVCVQHNIASHLSTSAVDSTPEQPGLRL